MKPSAGVASVLIFLFFIFFNGLQVFLIIERCSETKSRFSFACTEALISAHNEYNKLKAIDSAAMPRHARVSYSREKIEMSNQDTQSVRMISAGPLFTDTVDLTSIDAILNTRFFISLDFDAFDSLFKKSLYTNKINAKYRLDTISLQGRNSGRLMLQPIWARKRTRDYPYATRPVRIPQYSNFAVFAELKYDSAFFTNDLIRPFLAFAFILLIGNAALVFVYNTIRKQKKINEIKTDFINNITHEMKTPITIASAGLDALEHHVPATERINFYLNTSKRQLHILNDFVERILDAAVQDVSGFTLKKEKVDIHTLFGELIKSYSVLQGKPVSFEVTGKGPVYIYADRLHLETAFHNIIDNAIKYSNEAVVITINIVENSHECIIKIVDNGMGIPPQFIKNIFEKFFRVPQGDAQSIKGFGLGLYYVSNIIKKHSGNISVHSKLQSGTEFTITLPKYL